jgi:hypothetical protein
VQHAQPNLLLLYLFSINILGERYKLRIFSLSNFFHPPASSLSLSKGFPQHIFLKHEVARPYKTTGKITFLVALMLHVNIKDPWQEEYDNNNPYIITIFIVG